MTHDKEGNVVDAGRKTRTISTPLRRKLKERDQSTCRFPGCTNRYVDGHHVRHWAHGGATTLENLVSLCRAHHRAIHDFGFTVEHTADGFEFKDPKGHVLPSKPALLAPSTQALDPTELPPMPHFARIPDYAYAVTHLRSW